MIQIQRFLICLTVLLIGVPNCLAQTRLTPQQWREDLNYFATNVQKTHRNLFHSMTREQFESAIKRLDEREDPQHACLETEADVNRLGYELLRDNRIDEAIDIFRVNVDAYPWSANTYDSLAEAYLKKGNKELAIKYYSKALEVDPNFASSIEALRQLKN